MYSIIKSFIHEKASWHSRTWCVSNICSLQREKAKDIEKTQTEDPHYTPENKDPSQTKNSNEVTIPMEGETLHF